MGLQTDLSDISSGSLLIITAVFAAKTTRYLRSVFLSILHALGICSPRPDADDHFGTSLYDVVGSGLAGVILLCEQVNSSRVDSDTDRSDGSDCAVCLEQMCAGDSVGRLPCRHVFHKLCLDGWLAEMNFSCPLCRAPTVSEERVEETRRRVAGDVAGWCSFQ